MSAASHLAIAPIVIPALAAPIALLVMRRRRWLGVGIGFASCLAMLAAALILLVAAGDGTIRTYELGEWPAPFGIVLVVDRLSAIMLTLAASLSLIALTHAVITRADRKGWHFHSLFQFQMMGLNGAFLTGDLFNLFVFFEVLLIASYGLMLHGQGPARLKAGVQYVIVNIVGSSLFLIALGLLYALTGTLNMADMGLRVAAIAPDDQSLLRVAALLLSSVFALKAAIVPLHLWLPRTYAVSSPAVAALFAIMTKVGVYAMIRVIPQVFGDDAGAAAWVPAPYLLPAAIVTAIVGFAGVFVARELSEQAAYAVIGSTGTLMIAVAGWQQDTLGAAIYYLVHSTFAGAALFLVADIVARRRASYADRAVPGPMFQQRQLLALLFMGAAIAATGLPPLSGFIGKLLILRSVTDVAGWGWAWGAILGTTLIGVIGFARTGSAIFWKEAEASAGYQPPPVSSADLTAPIMALALLAGLSAGAGPVTDYGTAAAEQVLDRAATARAVLGGR
ncbi:MAG: monovalent cation/H+ antiporter subunit D [Novosphingobium sp. 28-62-57]|uniref:monovalent cation/H+ antiporter subunit D n=1 Tax=unclassified Novosphingobium TaxID=2644732 RepID=UPI000BC87629|nr:MULTISPECIES: monovalent cation/H+ antiporter subunit D [unclassified Novosphingobium]OYW48166.1 MAG: monovalent cation/H+ antiporter subunit D [Novosphingobium sp. 12-63-9]OYZ08920.1 MAG: monovalent cation/H+ antiporter subunit D [Novosphingobium sp. 28-62-57]OZA39631.1 MAG: monovalent cation/H+ antiporter subunit D [Novosphingobium sp. 17-62-9]HQS68277.1 monovalent cation/H+ antiporter subunit D [Novosphingobium sp.]